MPTENPFPLDINEKQDSWNKLQVLTNVAPGFKYTAEEFNKILQALNYLYENVDGGLTISDLYPYDQLLTKTFEWIPGTYSYRVLYVKWVKDGLIDENYFNQVMPLADGDAVFDRIDAIVFNFNTLALEVLPGDPADPPSLPALESYHGLITFIPVKANTTEPDDTTEEDVYLEDAEWTSAVFGSVIAGSALNPKNGAKSIYFNNASIGHYVSLTRGALLDASGASNLVLSIYLVSGNNPKFNITAEDDIPNFAIFQLQHNVYGFNKNLINQWQDISIPYSVFNISTQNLLKFTISAASNNLIAYIDDMKLQFGLNTSVNVGANSSKEVFTATDGQTAFLLSSSPNNVDVFIDRVPQIEGIDYTLSGSVVTLAEGAFANSKVIVRKY